MYKRQSKNSFTTRVAGRGRTVKVADSAALGMVRADPRAAVPARKRASHTPLAACGLLSRRHGDVSTRGSLGTSAAWPNASACRAGREAEESEGSVGLSSLQLCRALPGRCVAILWHQRRNGVAASTNRVEEDATSSALVRVLAAQQLVDQSEGGNGRSEDLCGRGGGSDLRTDWRGACFGQSA